jgi:hypothetical protein
MSRPKRYLEGWRATGMIPNYRIRIRLALPTCIVYDTSSCCRSGRPIGCCSMSTLKDAEEIVSSMGARAWLMTMGVIFPGLLITSELIWLYLLWTFPGQPILSPMVDQLGHLAPLVAFLFVVLALAVSCAVGYLNRDGSFALSNLWLKIGWAPARSLGVLLEKLQFVYGKVEVDKVINKYEIFGLMKSKDITSELPRLPESYVREFCKLWLATNRPILSTHGAEIEINIVIGLVVPTALAAVVLFASLRGLAGAALGLGTLFGACFLLYRVNAARLMETENALVNFMFAHWVPMPNVVDSQSGDRGQE